MELIVTQPHVLGNILNKQKIRNYLDHFTGSWSKIMLIWKNTVENGLKTITFLSDGKSRNGIMSLTSTRDTKQDPVSKKKKKKSSNPQVSLRNVPKLLLESSLLWQPSLWGEFGCNWSVACPVCQLLSFQNSQLAFRANEDWLPFCLLIEPHIPISQKTHSQSYEEPSLPSFHYQTQYLRTINNKGIGLNVKIGTLSKLGVDFASFFDMVIM